MGNRHGHTPASSRSSQSGHGAAIFAGSRATDAQEACDNQVGHGNKSVIGSEAVEV